GTVSRGSRPPVRTKTPSPNGRTSDPAVTIEGRIIPYNDNSRPIFLQRNGHAVPLLLPASVNRGHLALQARINAEAGKYVETADFVRTIPSHTSNAAASALFFAHVVAVRQHTTFIIRQAEQFIGPEVDSSEPSLTTDEAVQRFEQVLVHQPFGIQPVARLDNTLARNAYLRTTEARFLEALADYLNATG
ncbi:unnamed protein product, partial [Peniophora sp. CBMAI 1063]